MTLQQPPAQNAEGRAFWTQQENAADGAPLPLASVLTNLRWDADGLLPVVTQCAESGAVLMLAWMNREALTATLQQGKMVYFSRSRRALWRKGDTSGCAQEVVSLAVDCDGDALLATVKQTGAGACHTGRKSCFYIDLSADGATVRR